MSSRTRARWISRWECNRIRRETSRHVRHPRSRRLGEASLQNQGLVCVVLTSSIRLRDSGSGAEKRKRHTAGAGSRWPGAHFQEGMSIALTARAGSAGGDRHARRPCPAGARHAPVALARPERDEDSWRPPVPLSRRRATRRREARVSAPVLSARRPRHRPPGGLAPCRRSPRARRAAARRGGPAVR